MLIRTTNIHPKFGISYGYKRIGMKNPERLTIINTCGGNWMRRLVLNFMAPSSLRRRILDSI